MVIGGVGTLGWLWCCSTAQWSLTPTRLGSHWLIQVTAPEAAPPPLLQLYLLLQLDMALAASPGSRCEEAGQASSGAKQWVPQSWESMQLWVCGSLSDELLRADVAGWYYEACVCMLVPELDFQLPRRTGWSQKTPEAECCHRHRLSSGVHS